MPDSQTTRPSAAPAVLADRHRRMQAALTPEYDFEPRFLRSVGGPWMHYLDEGDAAGDPILCVHGNPSWSFHFRKVAGRFAASHRVVAPDLVGCGLSDKPSDFDYRLERHVDTLEGFVDALGLERITLVVQDWGGAIGLGFATRRPELVERLVILNSGAFRSRAMPPRIALARLPLLGRLGVRGFGLFSRLALSWAVERKRWTPAEKRGYLLPYASWRNRVAIDAFVQDIPLKESDPAWSVLAETEKSLSNLADKPVRFGWGARDFVFNDRVLEKWREIFPTAPVDYIEDAGHYVLEDAADQLVPAIRNFFAD